MSIQNLLLILFSVVISFLPLIKPIIQHRKSYDRSFFTDYKYEILTAGALCIGFCLRLINIGNMPLGLNQDEASIGYDAYSILNYGIDRNGVHMPVHLIAWGSGQNALYAYMCMPFIRLFGLNEFAIRLPMALLGCGSLLIIRRLLLLLKDKKLAFAGVCMFSIMPWHIMKSRWALESNILPDMILIAVLLFMLGIDGKKHCFYFGSAVLGLCAYAYGTAYFFLPIFCLMFFVYLLCHRKVSISQTLISLVIICIISLPIILFVLINKFGMQSINLGLFTIPKLNEARQSAILNLDSNIFENIFSNLKTTLKIIFMQTDDLPWNSISFYGTVFLASIPFFIIGLATMFKQKGYKSDFAFFIWFLTSLLMSSIMSANINRLNVIFIPIIYFVIIGVFSVVETMRHLRFPIITMYAAMSVMFIFNYFGPYQEQIGQNFYYGFGEAIQCAEKQDSEHIYITNSVNAPYIYVLFYNNTDPHEYINTVQKKNPGQAFEQVSEFDKYLFTNIDCKNLDSKACYIIKSSYAANVLENYSDAKIQSYGGYSVVYFN